MAPNKSTNPKELPIPSTWVKRFLALNLLLLLVFFLWQTTKPAFESPEEKNKLLEERAKLVETSISKNRPPKDISGTLGESLVYTVDSTELEQWVHFRFSTGEIFKSELLDRKSLEWDIAFRRAKIVTNGGATNKNGQAGVMAYDTDKFDSVRAAPKDGYILDTATKNPSEPENPMFDKWYDYDFWLHKLKPKPRVYVLRTADGHYAKMQIIDYYCGTVPACYKLKYQYNGTGSLSF